MLGSGCLGGWIVIAFVKFCDLWFCVFVTVSRSCCEMIVEEAIGLLWRNGLRCLGD